MLWAEHQGALSMSPRVQYTIILHINRASSSLSLSLSLSISLALPRSSLSPSLPLSLTHSHSLQTCQRSNRTNQPGRVWVKWNRRRQSAARSVRRSGWENTLVPSGMVTQGAIPSRAPRLCARLLDRQFSPPKKCLFLLDSSWLGRRWVARVRWAFQLEFTVAHILMYIMKISDIVRLF